MASHRHDERAARDAGAKDGCKRVNTVYVRTRSQERGATKSEDLPVQHDSEASTTDGGSSTGTSRSLRGFGRGGHGQSQAPRRVDETLEEKYYSASSSPERAARLEIGCQTMRGQKPWSQKETGQDVHFTLQLNGGKFAIGVFDGHGPSGRRAAEFAREQFTMALAPYRQGSSMEDEVKPLKEMFAKTQIAFRYRNWARVSGTTATVAIVDPSKRTMTCAHVGDSTLVMLAQDVVEFATRDHNFNLDEECTRAEACGSQVVECRNKAGVVVRRVCGLSVSRTLGDIDAHKHGACSEPEICQDVPVPLGSSIIVASDGLWNVMLQSEASKMVSRAPSAEAAARGLAGEAYPRWQEQGTYVDDITVVVVRAN